MEIVFLFIGLIIGIGIGFLIALLISALNLKQQEEKKNKTLTDYCNLLIQDINLKRVKQELVN